MLDVKAKEHCCEECAILPPGMNFYMPCNKPATKMIGWPARKEGPYRMCDDCAWHSVKNRGATEMGSYVALKRLPRNSQET